MRTTPLHPQLAKDCILLGSFPLSSLLLMNDSHYPWFILVPDRAAVSEIFQLSPEDQSQLLQESSALSRQLAQCFKADKMNLAALGNIVPQLHLHHIVRFTHDPAWPAPVWGKLPARPYTPAAIDELRVRLGPYLTDAAPFVWA